MVIRDCAEKEVWLCSGFAVTAVTTVLLLGVFRAGYILSGFISIRSSEAVIE